ncbi:MAG TPA: sugar transferase [Acetivibrio sp.]|uniref:sugar transferase n=1 Tax=Acetivibrio sp. TaxID=1872092 RepID=UPI002B7C27A0|nr:sugar transferase [Acetivibrio sp.]HOM02587.1 sugar transferase [Acetivibrio sp.]
MHSSNKHAFVSIGQLFLDIFFLILAFFVSYYIASHLRVLQSITAFVWVLLIYIPLWVSSMGFLGMYNKTTFNYYDRVLRNILLSSLISCMFVASFMFFIKETMFSRTLYSVFTVTSISFLVFERFMYIHFVSKHRRNTTTNVIFVGDRNIALKFIYFLQKTNITINVVGYVNVHNNNNNGTFNSKKALGYIENLEEILKNHVVDEVIFALPKDYVGDVEKYVCICEEMGITVRVILDLYNLKVAKTHFSCMGTLPMLTFNMVSINQFQLLIKRIMDIVGALVGLAITGIASIFIVPAIKLTSPGPVLFKQDRVGMNGRIFKIYKFRTMYVDAEECKGELMAQNQVKGGLMFKIKSDPRVTPVGRILRKTSLDELPQFFNVLKGDMSLVGTRPPTVDEVKKYKTYHRRRISFKPGVTGMWQVNGRSSITDFEDVVRLDTKYIDEWSIWLDLVIILKTIWVVLRKKDAY